MFLATFISLHLRRVDVQTSEIKINAARKHLFHFMLDAWAALNEKFSCSKQLKS